MASRAQAIDAYCKQCTYDDLDNGTWREQVERCTITSCPLWEVRPLTVKTANANRDAKKIPATEVA